MSEEGGELIAPWGKEIRREPKAGKLRSREEWGTKSLRKKCRGQKRKNGSPESSRKKGNCIRKHNFKKRKLY